jgi:hypothetical protein
VNCIVIPFCNFQDTVSAKIVYNQFLEKDSDGNALEFIANNLLNMEKLFENEEEEEETPQQKVPLPHEQPLHILQITPGLFISQVPCIVEKEKPATPRSFCFYKNVHYTSDYFSSIFHPPAFTG